ncbi:putative aldehyde dehydrogenase [Pseudomonas coronafaciens pv. coronafaciens]|nr:putative aldehyde dehydrogenase [Pseudomonas coronafaciens pv. coronafaciens]
MAAIKLRLKAPWRPANKAFARGSGEYKDGTVALAIANDSRSDLAAGVWTGDLSSAHRLARDTRSGIIWFNTFRAVSAMTPIGGSKRAATVATAG